MTVPLVSICLPTLNARRFLEARINSILAQTLADWELIVCDSHSDDGTWEYLQQFAGDPRVCLNQVAREGLYAGWNECLRRCRGEYVYVATADDTCAPIFLERMVDAIEHAKDLGTRQWHCREKPEMEGVKRDVQLAICGCDFIDESDRIVTDSDAPFYSFGKWNDVMHVRGGDIELLAHLCLGVSWSSITSILFRRSLLDKVGLFRTDCGPAADIFWAVRSAIFTDSVWIPASLATWRCYPEQNSREKSLALSKKLFDGLREMVAGLEGLLPESWLERDEWQGDLLLGWQDTYLRAYRLDRSALRDSPLKFLEGLGKAVVSEPRYLLKRFSHGFAWQCDAYLSSRDIFQKMLKKYEVCEPIPIPAECPPPVALE